jgi:quercetin dioxygenase-like cupin family protein
MKQLDLRPFLADGSPQPKAATLLRESGLRVLLLHLEDGEEIPEHQTSGAITVHCLKGNVSFVAGAEKLDLNSGVLVSLPPGSPHSLVANGTSVLLVTVSEQLPARS